MIMAMAMVMLMVMMMMMTMMMLMMIFDRQRFYCNSSVRCPPDAATVPMLVTPDASLRAS